MGGDAGQTQDAVACKMVHGFSDEGAGACALDDDVRLESDRADGAGVIASAELFDELGFETFCDAVEDVHFEATLSADEGCEQADGTGACDEHIARPPLGALTDARDVVPGFSDDAGWLQQHADFPEPGIEAHCESGFDAPPFGAEAVALLNTAFSVFSVAAHIPFADGTGNAGFGIGMAHDAGDQIAFFKAAGSRSLFDAAERFVPENEAVTTWGRPSVLGRDEFEIGAANA